MMERLMAILGSFPVSSWERPGDIDPLRGGMYEDFWRAFFFDEDGTEVYRIEDAVYSIQYKFVEDRGYQLWPEGQSEPEWVFEGDLHQYTVWVRKPQTDWWEISEEMEGEVFPLLPTWLVGIVVANRAVES